MPQQSPESSLSKVPEVTLAFWIIKIAATTLGETGGDTVTMTLNWGYLAGTLTLGLWYWSLGSISVNTVSTPKAEAFYWTAITFSQTLGTALGDWMADSIDRLRRAAAALHDQHDVSDIDDGRQRLADDDHGFAFDDAVDQRHQSASHREEPERHWHDALARAFAGYPLHQKTRGKEQLRDQPEREPEIEFGDEHIVKIVAERLAVLDHHHCTSVATGVGFLRRISHHTPTRSMIPIHSRSKKP